jgi:hypothetical protein
MDTGMWRRVNQGMARFPQRPDKMGSEVPITKGKRGEIQD